MRKIIFRKTETGSSWLEAVEDKDLLLDYFLSSNRHPGYLQTYVIDPLESVVLGEKTYDEVHDPQGVWTFGDSYCEFVVEGKTAYFSHSKGYYQALEMPLEEVVDYLKEWKAFLES